MRIVHTTFVLGVLTAALTSTAAADHTKKRSAQAATKQRTPAIDPRALGALCKMGAFLQAQQSFTVRTDSHTDFVTDDGQKLRLSAHGDLEVRRPDGLYARVVGDRKEREFFYDGETFTVYSPKLGYYSRVDAPPTILELADDVQTRFGVGLPLVDLFRWGVKNPDFSDIEQARYVGPATVDGVATDQYAFRQEGVDWQIWIERGARPLPRRLLITTTDDPTRPEHAVEMTWLLNTPHDNARFAFVPPEGSHLIAVEEVGPPGPAIEDTHRAKRSAQR